MTIPMVDLASQYQTLKEPIDAALAQVLASGYFILGPQGKALEQEIAAYLKVKHAITLNSGTDALVLALLACGIGPGDEVIVPTYTFFATPESVRLVGAIPVFVDCAAGSFNLDTDAVASAVTARTRAILPVHLFGEPVALEPLLKLCKQYSLRLIEDTAQSFGADYRGQALGSIGDVGTFSFYPSKNLGAYGDGGALVTNDDGIAELVRSLRDHGRGANGLHPRIGYNSRLDEFQAAILRVKLPRIDAWNAARRQRAAAYRQQLADTRCEFPAVSDDGAHVYHQCVVAHPERDRLRAALTNASIASAVHYLVPCHKQPAFADLGPVASLPVAERWSATTLALPICPELSMPSLERICEVIRAADRA